MTADRLALATRVMKARRGSVCTVCRSPVLVGQQIARLIRPAGWCHVGCVPVVASAHTTVALADDGDGDGGNGR
jgi:hypothetical protein